MHIRPTTVACIAWMSRFARATTLLAASCAAMMSTTASAFSTGSPVCSVSTAAMAGNEGSSVLTSPAGWSFVLPSTYVPGVPLTVTVQNTNATKTFRGILMWVQASDSSFQGAWTYPAAFQLPTSCTQASITHVSNALKSQPQTFTYTPPPGESRALTIRAVVTESGGRTSWAFLSETILPRAASPLNIDGSTAGAATTAATDGMLLLRYLFGLKGSALIDGVSDASATRNAATITQYLNTNRVAFDVDGDGIVTPASDGLLILRYLLGLRGTALTQGASASALPATEIERRISALL